MFIVLTVASGAMPWAKPLAPPAPFPIDLVATFAAVLLCWVVPLMLIYLEGFGFFEPTPKPRVKQTVVVTGATAGIGLDLVKTLAARGDKVFALVRKRAASWSGVDEISKVVGDVTIIEGVDVAKDGVVSVLARSALAGVTIDVLINNAGSLAGASQKGGFAQFAEYKLETITMDAMRNAYEVNTLGPLRVTKALMGQLATPGGKVVVINTGLGSIGDNGSGGNCYYVKNQGRYGRSARPLRLIGPELVLEAALSLFWRWRGVLEAELAAASWRALFSTNALFSTKCIGNYGYRTSKAAANMVTKCLAADLKGKGVAVCAVAPGFVATNFGGEVSVMQKMGAAPVGQATGGILCRETSREQAWYGRPEPPKQLIGRGWPGQPETSNLTLRGASRALASRSVSQLIFDTCTCTCTGVCMCMHMYMCIHMHMQMYML